LFNDAVSFQDCMTSRVDNEIGLFSNVVISKHRQFCSSKAPCGHSCFFAWQPFGASSVHCVCTSVLVFTVSVRRF
jgi:hypothetical protein